MQVVKIISYVLILFLMGCSTRKEFKPVSENTVVTLGEVALFDREPPKEVILFFGNSITAGYQLDMDQTFPAIIQHKLDSLGYHYQVINAGLSGETTASGVNRIDWVLKTVPDIFVLELGANDGLRGLPLIETPKNLQRIIDKVKAVNPKVKIIITGMEVPPNLGASYTDTFRKIFPDLAQKNAAVLIPFLLEGVAGIEELNLGDGIHPTPQGHQIVAELVWKALLPLLSPHI